MDESQFLPPRRPAETFEQPAQYLPRRQQQPLSRPPMSSYLQQVSNARTGSAFVSSTVPQSQYAGQHYLQQVNNWRNDSTFVSSTVPQSQYASQHFMQRVDNWRNECAFVSLTAPQDQYADQHYLRRITNARNDSVFVLSTVPQDQNVGQPAQYFPPAQYLPRLGTPGTWSEKAWRACPVGATGAQKATMELQRVLKRTPSIELLKIDDLDNYMEACAEYNRELRRGASDEELLQLIDEIKRRPSKAEGEDEFLI